MSSAARPLWDRQQERAALSQLLLDVRSGRSRALVLRGEAGIGKTALLENLRARAGDVVLVRGSGVESEAELAYAGLHQMFSQMIEEKLDLLPDPQREAIRIAFGESSGDAPNPFLLGLAVLNRLADAAAERPVLCLVDDAQWLDQATAQTLSFVARRLDAEQVGIVFAVREPAAQFDGLPELILSGLAPEDARHLLRSALTAPVDEAVRERFIAETRGNPLALLELSRRLTAGGLQEAFDRHDSRGLWVRLEESFQRRVEGVSADARTLLLIAAAEPAGDPTLLWRTADLLGVPRDAVDSLENSGLLQVGATVEFRHPLVRSAVYRLATAGERRSAHGALADVTDPELDPDRRAWHLALAAAGPDEQVAVELERSGDRARARGGYAAEAAFLERALTLTADFDRRAVRALAAARARLAAGEPHTARDLLSVAERGPLDELRSAELDVLRARIAFAVGRGGDAPALLLKAAKSLEPLDPIGAREAYLDAMRAILFAGRFAHDTGLRDVAVAARAVTWTDPPEVPDLLLRAFATLILDGYRAGAPLSLQTVAALRYGDFSTAEDLGWLVLGAQLALTLWDAAAWDELTQRQLRLARDTGQLDVLPIALTNRAITHILAGELAAAASLVQEIEMVSEATGIPTPPYAAVATAVFGSPAEAFTLIEDSLQAALDRGEGGAVKWVQLEQAILCNALGRYEDALTAAASAYEEPVLYSVWIGTELIESAARSGHPERAARALENLGEMASAAGTDWVLGVAARCRALLADDEAAEDLYRASIGHLERTRQPVDAARSHLVYGEWLRREGRRIDARQQLRIAREMFDAIGAVAFTDRAARELAATGETFRKRRPGDNGLATDLTVREAQIARLAADGLSNREIGEQLFISHRTVGYHLSAVFSKLDVANRTQLRNALDRGKVLLAQLVTSSGVTSFDRRDAAAVARTVAMTDQPRRWLLIMADPTIVLVHGAFEDASSWRRLYAELAGDRLMIKAPPNPLRGVTVEDAEYTQCVVEQVEGPVLLVGHSYGGAVISAAGVADNVVGLVYVAGFAPDEGEDLGSLQSNFPATAVGAYIKPSPLPDGAAEFTIDPSRFREAFCADLPAAEAAFMAISQRPLSGVAFGEKAPAPAWRTRPSWAVLPAADNAIHPDVHHFSYDRMGATVTVVEGASHAAMLSRPEVVADVVREAIRSCGAGGS